MAEKFDMLRRRMLQGISASALAAAPFPAGALAPERPESLTDQEQRRYHADALMALVLRDAPEGTARVSIHLTFCAGDEGSLYGTFMPTDVEGRGLGPAPLFSEVS